MCRNVAACVIAVAVFAGGMSIAHAAVPELVGGTHMRPGCYAGVVLLDRMPRLPVHGRVWPMGWGVGRGFR